MYCNSLPLLQEGSAPGWPDDFAITHIWPLSIQREEPTVLLYPLPFQYPHAKANSKIYYLQYCCFWAKTCKLICWYPGSQPGVI